jgi:asparagine synthase (glutamine-hydrolysing)
MRKAGASAALCGEGADSLFGVGLTVNVQNAKLLRRIMPYGWQRGMGKALARRVGQARHLEYFKLADSLEELDDLEHPVNQVAMFTNPTAVVRSFGESALDEATAYRRELLSQQHIPDDPLEQVNFAGFLGEAADTASLWTTLFNLEGAEMLCPFLDSRLLRLAMNLDPRVRFPYGKPKHLLKQALKQHAPAWLADRVKLGFGQPVFDWLAPGGPLRPLVDRIDDHEFLGRRGLAAAKESPDWFLYSLLCYDVWHKTFISGTIRGDDVCTP